ncbi:MAG: DUF4012 domain-containing protein, partial [Actinomycetota bacterium]|nr:DUF4012 domain-containing protein [Actinomycetota bacterium]
MLHTAAAGFFFARDMRSGAADLRSALRALRSAEMETAESELASARAVLARATARFDAPGIAALGELEPLTDDVDALQTLALVAEDVAGAGLTFVQALGIHDAGDVYSEGTLDLDATERAVIALDQLDADLADVSTRLDAISDTIVRPIRVRVARTERLLAATRATVERADAFVAMVPSFAGAEEPRRYFVAFQSPSEARGGGGLVGVYGILRADAGHFELTRVDTIETLVRAQRATARRARAVAVPGWFRATYGPFGALDDWRMVNLSPNFPVTGEVILDLYEAHAGAPLDGVIALD